jgi:predicted glycogen debranching enzyme
MVYRLDAQQCRNFELSSRREWIITGGDGSYAMGTVSGANTRRYHGHLVVAAEGLERYVLLYNIEASIEVDGRRVELSTNQYSGAVHPEGYQYVTQFDIYGRTVSWVYEALGNRISKHIVLLEQCCMINYENGGSQALLLRLRPLLQNKFYHGNFRESADLFGSAISAGESVTVGYGKGSTRIEHQGGAYRASPTWYHRLEHLREFERGLDAIDDAYSLGEFEWLIAPGDAARLLVGPAPADIDPASNQLIWASETPHLKTEGRDILQHPSKPLKAALAEASLNFLVKTSGRTSLIAGYPWFTDWGRDTMISLPGICLHVAPWYLAKEILLGYISQMHQGLIPNRMVESGEAEYNTADGTLWFVHAAYKTLQPQWDDELANACADAFEQVLEWHLRGTLYGIGVDPADGLLRQGEEGVQLTWMDARVGDEVITPRHGKAVEINGLWINALRVMAWLKNEIGRPAGEEEALAAKASQSFEERFWNEDLGYYLDVVDPDDAALRPNQVIALSLPFVAVDEGRAKRAVAAVGRDLLTARGLRTLSPSDSRYKGRFEGSMAERDRAYHQGTVWPWLLGPYVTALVRYTGDKKEAKRILRYAKEMLGEYGLGGIAEVYDGDQPQNPGGCPWQAWSVAEILRAWVEDVNGD